SQGDLNKAQLYSQQALQIQPRNPAARAMAIRVSLQKGDAAKAAVDLAALEKEFPNSPSVLDLSAGVHMVAGRMDAARAAYTRTLTSSPDDLEAIEGLTLVDLRAGRKKEAVDRIENAMKRMPPSAALYSIAARANFNAGNS